MPWKCRNIIIHLSVITNSFNFRASQRCLLHSATVELWVSCTCSVALTEGSVYLNLGDLTPSDHSSNLRGQITQMKQKPKFVWLRAYDHTSKPNRTNHTNLNKSKNWVKQEIKSHELCIPSKNRQQLNSTVATKLSHCNKILKPK